MPECTISDKMLSTEEEEEVILQVIPECQEHGALLEAVLCMAECHSVSCSIGSLGLLCLGETVGGSAPTL